MDISLSNAIIAEAAQSRDQPFPDGTAAAARVLQPLLGGENVRVSAALTGDLQKLLAQIRSEQDEKKLQLAHQRLSGVLGNLCAMSGVTSAQQAQVVEIQMQIESLEEAIERETTTVEDRKKALEAKRRLESDAQKDLESAEKSGDKEKIAEARDRLAGVRAEVAALDMEIAQHDVRISELEKEVAGCGDRLSGLLAKLDYPALVLVLAAITLSADDVTPNKVPQTDDADEKKKGVPTPLEVLRESLERAVKDIREEIVEKRIEPV